MGRNRTQVTVYITFFLSSQPTVLNNSLWQKTNCHRLAWYGVKGRWPDHFQIFHMMISPSRGSISPKTPNYKWVWIVETKMCTSIAHRIMCAVFGGNHLLLTFVFITSKGNMSQASNFTGIMRKIWAFFWYQNLNLDRVKWGDEAIDRVTHL